MSDALPRNYYADMGDTTDGLKYRLGSDEVLLHITRRLRGARYDENGRFLGYDEKLRLMNERGVFSFEVFVESVVNKITSLSNYENEERVNRQVKPYFKTWAFDIALNAREWEIRDKDLVQQIAEQVIINNIKRAVGGFENLNISRIHQVLERIGDDDSPRDERKSMFKMFRGGLSGN